MYPLLLHNMVASTAYVLDGSATISVEDFAAEAQLVSLLSPYYS
jgi:hypothetical protein